MMGSFRRLTKSWCQLQGPEGLGSCSRNPTTLGDMMKTSDCVSDESTRLLGEEGNNNSPAASREFATQSLTAFFFHEILKLVWIRDFYTEKVLQVKSWKCREFELLKVVQLIHLRAWSCVFSLLPLFLNTPLNTPLFISSHGHCLLPGLLHGFPAVFLYLLLSSLVCSY